MIAGVFDRKVGDIIHDLETYFGEYPSFAYLAQFYVDTHNHIADTLESMERSKKELASVLTDFYVAEPKNAVYRKIIETLASECGSLGGFVNQLIGDLEHDGDITPTGGKYRWTGERIKL